MEGRWKGREQKGKEMKKGEGGKGGKSLNPSCEVLHALMVRSVCEKESVKPGVFRSYVATANNWRTVFFYFSQSLVIVA